MSRVAASEQPAAEAGSYRLDDHEFGLLRALIERESGIQLPDAKRALLVARLARRLRALGLRSFGAYYRRVTRDGDLAERTRMLDLITTNETQFFRQPRQFELLERELIPAWKAAAEAGDQPRQVRVWSAACSSGEEPYSVAMTLLHHLAGWRVEVIATDLSTRMLDQARAATWPVEKSRDIPEHYLRSFMLRGVGVSQGVMKAGKELRECVQFVRLNLHAEQLAVEGLFDLILCRNVLIYFSAEGRARVLRKLVAHLGPRGHLFLGHAETLSGAAMVLRSSGPSAYTWDPRPAGRRRR